MSNGERIIRQGTIVGCTGLVYGLCAVAFALVFMLAFFLIEPQETAMFFKYRSAISVARLIYVVGTMVTFFSLIIGVHTAQCTLWGRPWQRSFVLAAILCLFVFIALTQWLAAPLAIHIFAQMSMRGRVLIRREPLRPMGWLVVYALIAAAIIGIGHQALPRDDSNVIAFLITAMALSMPFSDVILIWRLARWQKQGVHFETSSSWRFSLATLMSLTLVGGGWVSGLVLLFGR